MTLHEKLDLLEEADRLEYLADKGRTHIEIDGHNVPIAERERQIWNLIGESGTK